MDFMVTKQKDCTSCVYKYLSPMSDICRGCGIAMLHYVNRDEALNGTIKLNSFKEEIGALFNSAVFCLTADEYEELCDYAKAKMIGC